MTRLPFQVLRRELSKPDAEVGMFAATRRDSTDYAFLGAERMRVALSAAGIRFAAVDGDPLISFYVGEKDAARAHEVYGEVFGAQSAGKERSR